MPGIIETAYVEVRPLLTGFGAATATQVKAELAGADIGAAASAGAQASVRAGLVESESSRKTALSVQDAAKVKIAAFAQEREALGLLAAEYQRVAASAIASSEERVAAAKLAADANAKLALGGAAGGRAGLAGEAGLLGVGSKIAGGFIGVTVAALAVDTLAHAMRGAVDDAGVLQKSGEAIGLEFGKSGGAVKAFANDAAKIGISAKDSEALSVRIGILAHNLGIGQGKAADMAVNLQKLAGSIAEIRGVDPTTILANLPQALAGNLRSLKQLGFAFSQQQIQQEGVREGFLKTGEALTPQTKALGVYGLLVQQLGFFEAQAAKHTGDLTNRQHQLNATTENTRTTLGSLLTGPLAKITGGLTTAENAVAKFITTLAENEQVKAAFKELGSAIGGVLEQIGKNVRLFFTAVKPLLPLLGFVLVGAVRQAAATLRLFADVMELTRKVVEKVVDGVVIRIDKFLGAFSSLARGLSHIPVVGDKFKGVADKIDLAREHLRAFSSDLDAIDGKTVTVNLDLRAPSGIVSNQPGAILPPGTVGGQGATAGRNPKPFTPTPNIPPVVAAQEKFLQDQVSLAQANDNKEGERKALQVLAAFYAREAQNFKLATALRRAFNVQRAQAEQQIRALDAQGAADAKAASDANAQAAKDRAAVAVSNRQALLEANLRIAQATQATLKDDERALRLLVDFFKGRVRILKLTTAAGRSALADERSAQNDLNALVAQEQATKDAAILDRLNDNRTLAGFTKGTADDRRALTALEKFYAQKVANSKRGSVARRKWKIELERVKAELADLAGTEKDVGNDFKQQAFSFLTTQQGFAANLVGNLIGNTKGLVGGTTPSGATPLPTPGPGEKQLPGRQGLQAQATAEAGGRAPSSTQLEVLISLARQQLQALQALKAGSAHPEAREARSMARSGTEVTHA